MFGLWAPSGNEDVRGFLRWHETLEGLGGGERLVERERKTVGLVAFLSRLEPTMVMMMEGQVRNCVCVERELRNTTTTTITAKRRMEAAARQFQQSPAGTRPLSCRLHTAIVIIMIRRTF